MYPTFAGNRPQKVHDTGTAKAAMLGAARLGGDLGTIREDWHKEAPPSGNNRTRDRRDRLMSSHWACPGSPRGNWLRSYWGVGGGSVWRPEAARTEQRERSQGITAAVIPFEPRDW